MRRRDDIPTIPETGKLVLAHYDEDGTYAFSRGTWGQVKFEFDTPKETGSCILAPFEAEARLRALRLKDWRPRG